jgi:hypothetical protein
MIVIQDNNKSPTYIFFINITYIVMLPKLQQLTINNYINSNCSLSPNKIIFSNVLFLKQLNNNNLISILNDPKNYIHIKKIILETLPNNNISNALSNLEKHGFCSFVPFKLQNKTIQNLLNNKYNFLLKDNYTFPYFKICTNMPSSIFDKSSNHTILHSGILKFLQLINDDMFVPYTIFNDDPYNDLVMYNTNTHLKNILIASNNDKVALPRNQIILLCNLSTTLIDSLGEFLDINKKNMSNNKI